MRRTSLLCVMFCTALAGARAGAGEPAAAPQRARLRVVTTLPDYADLVRRLAGGRASVQAIVRGDQDAHFIRPKPSFVTAVSRADGFATFSTARPIAPL